MEREDARKLSPEAQHERRRQVIRAYKRGVNRRQIARDLGLSYSSVRMVVNRCKQAGLRHAATNHMAVIEKNPERIKAFFKNPIVADAA